MGLETDYVEYGVELSLAILGLSAAYFIDPSRPITFLSLLFIPLLYGYTAYISHDGFNYASLVALSGLMFTVVGGLTAVIAVFYGVGNVLVSFFSYGTRFKDFYGSTSLPVLVMSFLLGASIFAYGAVNPGFQEDLSERAGSEIGDFAGDMISESGIIEEQRNSQMRMINSTAVLAVRLTSQEVMNKTERSYELQQAFVQSEEPVKERVYDRFSEEFDRQDRDLSTRVEERMAEQMKKMNFIMVIPIVTGFIYGIQPILGILTGLFGKFFLLVDS
jgi:hypothetical protein